MDIEQLSKSQIILLTLFVSFVTSIATGIVTVSLMEQAPPAIAQTVNRIIEHTVEKVVPSGQTAATVVTQEKTIVVKESDLVAAAVKKISPSVVRLYTRDSQSPVFLGLGIVLDASGTLVADTASLGEDGDAAAVLPDGTRVRALVKARDAANGLAFLQAATSTGEGSDMKLVAWSPATIAADRPVLGSSIVAVSGKTALRIDDGLVTAFAQSGGGDIIDTNISEEAIIRGGPIMNVDGNIVGVSTEASRASSLTGFVSAIVLLPREESVKEGGQKK